MAPGRGLAGRAHAHRQDHPAGRGASVRGGGVPVRVRQDRTWPCCSRLSAGWQVETIGDDIAWMRLGRTAGSTRSTPRRGSSASRRAPGCGPRQRGGDDAGRLHLHQRRADQRRRHVVGGPDRGAAARLTDWRGRDWTPGCGHAPRAPMPGSPTGGAVPVIAAVRTTGRGADLGDPVRRRRASTVPLVIESFDSDHRVFLGANVASEKTTTAEGTVGELRHDPFAMLPFCGYDIGDYFGHWLSVGRSAQRPSCRGCTTSTGSARRRGRFVWPGFGENVRVLSGSWSGSPGRPRRCSADRAAARGRLAGPRRPGYRGGRPGPAAHGRPAGLEAGGGPGPRVFRDFDEPTCPRGCGSCSRTDGPAG